MAKQGTSKKHSLQNDLDSEFDFDEYLDDQANEGTSNNQLSDDGFKEERSDLIKNSLLVVAVITTIFLWIFDWSPNNAYNYFFEGDSPVFVFEEGNQNIIPEAPQIPAFESVVEANQSLSATEYLVELRDKGLLEEGKISTFDARQLYSSGVPISYLELIDGANLLDEFSFVDLSEFYENRVPVEYLQSLDQAGYLDELSFVDITEFYENNVPIQYLNSLKEIGIMDELSFVEITEFYENNVSIDYLSTLQQNDYIGDLSFVEITEFYENGVTIEFLNELKSNGLLDQLNFIDIVDLYKGEGN